MQSTATVPPAPLEIDEDLLERFGGRGPRYTSYPTADRFHDGFGAADYERALQDRAQRRDDPLGLYVHVPFCRTICWYCACNKIGTKHQEQSAPYLEAVLRELSLVVDRIGRGGQAPVSERAQGPVAGQSWTWTCAPIGRFA